MIDRRRVLPFVAAVLIVISVGCGGKSAGDAENPPKPVDPGPAGGTDRDQAPPPKFDLTSPTIQHRGPIPAEYTCDGAGTAPALNWSKPPDGTKSMVLIVSDPDAPKNFVHWLLYNLPPERGGIPAGLPADGELAELGGAKQGQNGFGKSGWGPPCPPAGASHRYVFRIYAIDTMLDAPAGIDRGALESAMEGHFRGQAAIIATYSRKP